MVLTKTYVYFLRAPLSLLCTGLCICLKIALGVIMLLFHYCVCMGLVLILSVTDAMIIM